MSRTKKPDIYVENHGSIILFRPTKPRVKLWLKEHTDGHWFGGALAVEPRFAAVLSEAATADGWRLE